VVLALTATGIVILALLGEVMLPRIEQAIGHHRARRRRSRPGARRGRPGTGQ
jgi:hypothetical protein